MENPFAGLGLRRTLVAGCPCQQTKTAAAFIERPSSLFHNPHGNLPPRVRYSMVPAVTKVGEGVAVPSKLWTDADVEKERSASAWKGIALGATAGLLVGWWVL